MPAGAPFGNKHASRAAQIRGEIRDAFERRDRANGKLEGWSLRELMDQFVAEAYTDRSVRSELFDRLYGKPVQALAGDAENPLELVQRVERVIVRAQSENPNG